MAEQLTNDGKVLTNTSDTLGAIADRLTALKNAGTTSTSSTSTKTIDSTPTKTTNPLLEALTERLLKQGQGISTSTSSNLQNSINDAIAQTQTAGELTGDRIQSERTREVAFAQDRAASTYQSAIENRSGYATQTAAFRELTDTTEKSVRDLDQRYQEALLLNDAATAQRVSDLTMQKLGFQMQQEQNYFSNLMQVAGMAQQEEQFYQTQEQNARNLALQMAQSQYQFDKNLGIQYKELELAAQGLELERERNQISWADYNLRKKDLAKSVNYTNTQMQVTEYVKKLVNSGVDPNDIDPIQIAGEIGSYLDSSGIAFDGSTEDFSTIINTSVIAARAMDVPPIYSTQRTGGFLQSATDVFSTMYGPALNSLKDFYLGSPTQVRTN